ncbi:hypothetical protein LWI29_002083 [Acer saccharum]|uniref:Uncharacterized protein n=1 Tax=Acer saccharum TaxID=4024 RepID=A0AA39V856_ACESA|nr:hypothetical protein LWI29_002083 [Acer saccharum]
MKHQQLHQMPSSQQTTFQSGLQISIVSTSNQDLDSIVVDNNNNNNNHLDRTVVDDDAVVDWTVVDDDVVVDQTAVEEEKCTKEEGENHDSEEISFSVNPESLVESREEGDNDDASSTTAAMESKIRERM